MMAEFVKLKTLIKQVRGVSYSQEDVSEFAAQGYIPLLRATNITNKNSIDKSELVFVNEGKVKKEQLLREGDILIAASSGSIEIVGKAASFEDDDLLTFGAFCKVIRPDRKKVNPRYISLFFQTDYYRKRISFLAQGANINNLRNEHIDELEVLLPDLDTQNKIVAILDKANGLVKKREETIARYDELLRATFLDMFGDPVLNKMGWPQVALSNKKYFKISGGGTPSKSKDDYFNGDILWVTPKDMKSELIQSSKVKITEKGLENSTAKLVDKFSTLIVVRSGILKHTIPVAINVAEISVNQDLKTVTPLVTKPYFTYWCIKLHEPFLLGKVRAVTADNIDTKILMGIKIINPDISKQEHFDQIARDFYRTKQKAEESTNEINTLKDALSQLAFKGELTFNTAVDLEVLLENDYDFFRANSTTQSIQLLLDRLDKDELNDKKIYEEDVYNKAKSFVFGLLQEGRIKQAFDEQTKTLKLALA